MTDPAYMMPGGRRYPTNWNEYEKNRFYVFMDDGSFTIHPSLPSIESLTSYACYGGDGDRVVWWKVELQTGMNIPTWFACTPEDVPSGLRAMALLIAE